MKENDWLGLVPGNEMPRVLNPERGFVVNANNKITTDNYKYDIGVGMSGTTRADRITEMLEERMAKGKLTTKDFLEMQYDKKDILAEALTKSMVKIY